MGDFPLATFRILYPQFVTSSDEVVLTVADQALCYIDTNGCECDNQGWMLLVAHLLFIRDAIAGGSVPPGAVQSATIGSVSVSFQAAPSIDGWAFWLNQTPYGQQFLALTAACFGAGFYVGGAPERAAFRSVGGYFPRGGDVE